MPSTYEVRQELRKVSKKGIYLESQVDKHRKNFPLLAVKWKHLSKRTFLLKPNYGINARMPADITWSVIKTDNYIGFS